MVKTYCESNTDNHIVGLFQLFKRTCSYFVELFIINLKFTVSCEEVKLVGFILVDYVTSVVAGIKRELVGVFALDRIVYCYCRLIFTDEETVCC